MKPSKYLPVSNALGTQIELSLILSTLGYMLYSHTLSYILSLSLHAYILASFPGLLRFCSLLFVQYDKRK